MGFLGNLLGLLPLILVVPLLTVTACLWLSVKVAPPLLRIPLIWVSLGWLNLQELLPELHMAKTNGFSLQV
jgi:hypothetical protein